MTITGNGAEYPLALNARNLPTAYAVRKLNHCEMFDQHDAYVDKSAM